MNFKSKLQKIIIPLFLVLVACGGGGGGNPTGIEVSECTVAGENKFVYEVMQDLYLYYDQLPAVNPNDYSSPRALLSDIIAPNDQFSFISDRQTQQNFETGTYIGIGFSFINGGDVLTLTSVFNDSAAGRAGLQRSDKIHSVDGVSITQINEDGGLLTFLSNYNEGESIPFSISSASAEPTNIVMSKDLVRINTVLKTDVITANTLKVGYLAFSSFIEPSRAELQTAFNTFQQESIDELVLDLRYNSGGLIDVAQLLASYIAGDNAVGADVTKLIYNDKNSNLNRTFPFLSLHESIDIDRLYVLTLEGTCSASEIVINAMQPVGIDVITIGQTTCGKPLGSRVINFCDKSLSAISFDIVNDINQADYINGIAATCAANDDFNSLYADPNESMFATALYHIENDQCPVTSRSVSKTVRNTKLKRNNPADIMRTLY